jgi:hypothetical protein
MARQHAQQMFDLANNPTYTGQVTPTQQASMENTLRDDYESIQAPNRQTMKYYGQSVELVQERGGFDQLTGSDGVALIRNFIKSITPNEAVMSDDQRAVAAANGLGGTIAEWKGYLSGRNQMSGEQVAQIMGTMRVSAERAAKEGAATNALFTRRTENAGLNPENVVRPWEALENVEIPGRIAPGGSAPAPGGQSVSDWESTLVPYEPGGGGRQAPRMRGAR